MAQVTDRSVSPYKESCFIQAIYADGTVLRGSGTVVGTNDVLTALHVIYNADHGGWATHVSVTPGALVGSNSFSAPLGTYSAESWTGYSSNWDTNNDGIPSLAESGHDLGLLNFDLNLASLTGSLQVTNSQQNFTGTIVGYPARGSSVMQESVNATYFANESVFRVDAALGVGASGGALVDSNHSFPTVSGVLSAGDSAYTYAIYAAMTGANLSWYQAAAAANDVLLDVSSAYRPMGAGISSGSDHDDRLLQARLSYDADNLAKVYGYQGTDTLVMQGSYARYIVATSNGALTVTDHQTGAQLELYDINVLNFLDRTLYVLSEEQAQIARLYSGFGRAPDVDGLQGWLSAYSQGTSFQSILSGFADSAEFTGRYGQSSDTQFVSDLYGTVLDRQADTSGMTHWLEQLEAGFSRQDTLLAFTESAENRQHSEGTIGYLKIVAHNAWSAHDLVIQPGLALGTDSTDHLDEAALLVSSNEVRLFAQSGIDVLQLDGAAGGYLRDSGKSDVASVTLVNLATGVEMQVHDVEMLSFSDRNVLVLTSSQAQIARLYTAFDRTPDLAGMHDWTIASRHGTEFAAIAQSFTQSAEFSLHYGGLTTLEFVESLYGTVLGRPAEAAGAAHWIDALERGSSRAEVLIAFTDSSENQYLTQGPEGFIQLVGTSDWT
ncbi:DUF4214 domain-containing protein [Pseudomonas oryzihabitans]|uniref:DUF4214 domain-containing protein n=1 Tax=Pseudomonas oryzihabitans TaxID=47885 RepID=UPI003EC04C42